MNQSELNDLVGQVYGEGGPFVGQVFYHYKGGLYSIVALSHMEDTLKPVVTYCSNANGTYWTRTVENFTEMVDCDGRIVPRFGRVEG